MYDQTVLLNDLEVSLTKRSEAWCGSALKKLTMLFVAGAENFSTQHVALYDMILPRFIDSVDPRTLVEISSALANIEKSPPVMAECLARHRHSAVAIPILEKSEALLDGVLVDLVSSCDLDCLLAIAGRKNVSAAVSDAILQRKNSAVNRRLVANTSAVISEIGFVQMMDAARRDSVLATSIRLRTDIPTELRPFFDMPE